MSLTPMDRRVRIRELMEADEECRRMMAALEAAKQRFGQYADTLPEEARTLLWEYPGMGYFLHHRILSLICSNMKFIDEP